MYYTGGYGYDQQYGNAAPPYTSAQQYIPPVGWDSSTNYQWGSQQYDHGYNNWPQVPHYNGVGVNDPSSHVGFPQERISDHHTLVPPPASDLDLDGAPIVQEDFRLESNGHGLAKERSSRNPERSEHTRSWEKSTPYPPSFSSSKPRSDEYHQPPSKISLVSPREENLPYSKPRRDEYLPPVSVSKVTRDEFESRKYPVHDEELIKDRYSNSESHRDRSPDYPYSSRSKTDYHVESRPQATHRDQDSHRSSAYRAYDDSPTESRHRREPELVRERERSTHSSSESDRLGTAHRYRKYSPDRYSAHDDRRLVDSPDRHSAHNDRRRVDSPDRYSAHSDRRRVDSPDKYSAHSDRRRVESSDKYSTHNDRRLVDWDKDYSDLDRKRKRSLSRSPSLHDHRATTQRIRRNSSDEYSSPDERRVVDWDKEYSEPDRDKRPKNPHSSIEHRTDSYSKIHAPREPERTDDHLRKDLTAKNKPSVSGRLRVWDRLEPLPKNHTKTSSLEKNKSPQATSSDEDPVIVYDSEIAKQAPSKKPIKKGLLGDRPEKLNPPHTKQGLLGDRPGKLNPPHTKQGLLGDRPGKLNLPHTKQGLLGHRPGKLNLSHINQVLLTQRNEKTKMEKTLPKFQEVHKVVDNKAQKKVVAEQLLRNRYLELKGLEALPTRVAEAAKRAPTLPISKHREVNSFQAERQKLQAQGPGTHDYGSKAASKKLKQIERDIQSQYERLKAMIDARRGAERFKLY
ncbi:hypothetical protein QAD02_005453 [Eretmocerus hayati]|uniref:Uncharacterized protein n=1 Tax=Eretmocerus hayati TaxID=131215 RepID=A0ACC2NTM1_9HYME|nr:hypothetical protein QAD02_005453 [Eretmocerus hayati]